MHVFHINSIGFHLDSGSVKGIWCVLGSMGLLVVIVARQL